VLREKTLKTFVPVPYWTIKAQAELNNEIFEATYEKEAIEAKKEAYDILNASRNRDGQIMKIDKRQFQQMPPTPLDIGTLQGTAYSSFGYVPKYTLDTAQRLYLEALISYPRTSSQKLPPTIDYRTILQKLSRERSYREPTMQLLSKTMLKPNEGKKDDPAHPAIYPTGDLPKRALTSSERNIWDLIVRRFMAAFGGPATMESMKVRININGHIFFLKGIHTMMEGWRRFYQPYVRSKELLLPSLQEGQQIKIERIILEAKFTKPPSRYNPGSLLKKMEAEEIGTKATRAEIMQTLQERKYIQGKTMVVTELGFEVSDVLEKHCPVVASVKFTRELEEKMSKIQEKVETKENVLHKAIATLKPVLEKLKEDEEEIGEQLGKALQEARMRERIIGPCPVCKTGQLIVVHSAKTGKRFIGCTNYFKNLCKTSSSLPQKGFLKSGGKTCSTCGWPTIKVMFVARRPWVFCPNPNCESKKRRRTD
jgi:DNA topoisomerase-1